MKLGGRGTDNMLGSLVCWGFILFSTNVISCFSVCVVGCLFYKKKLRLFKVSSKRVKSIFPSTFQGTYLEIGNCVLHSSFLRDTENLSFIR